MRSLFAYSSFLPVLCLVLLFCTSACKKDDSVTTQHEDASDAEIILRENVHVIDSGDLKLNLSESLLTEGKFVFDLLQGEMPDFRDADVIVGAEQGGFLRKIQTTSLTQDKAILTTRVATLGELFVRAHFEHVINSADLFDLDGTITTVELERQNIWQESTGSFDLLPSSIELVSEWQLEFEVIDAQLTEFFFGSSQVGSVTNIDMSFYSHQQVNFARREDTIARFSMQDQVWLDAHPKSVPIVVEFELLLVVSSEIWSDDGLSVHWNTQSAGSSSLSVDFSSNSWHLNNEIDVSPDVGITSYDEPVNAGAEITVRKVLLPKFFGQAASGMSLDQKTLADARVTTQGDRWDISMSTNLQHAAEDEAFVLGEAQTAVRAQSWQGPSAVYRRPNHLEIVSGNGQTAQPGQALLQPIKLVVLDSDSMPVEGVFVTFEPQPGDGLVSQPTVTTNASGFALTEWFLDVGSNMSALLDASVVDGSGMQLTNSPIQFVAYPDSNHTPGFGSFTDSRDGNTYATIQIGNQNWMAENLRYTGVSFICYDRLQSNCTAFGPLYEYYPALSACPPGWRLPSDDDWKELEMFLGMSQAEADEMGQRGTTEGGKLKEAGFSSWETPNTGATNSSGFTALAAGTYASDIDFFGNLTYGAHFWTSTEIGSSWAYTRVLYFSNSQISRFQDETGFVGNSCRCIKD